MKRILIHLAIALLTFITGVATSALWYFLRPAHSNLSDSQHVVHHLIRLPQSSKYDNPSVPEGLFFAIRDPHAYLDSLDEYDQRAFVLSYDGQPIESSVNAPNAPTLPGFHLSNKVRFEFERVEVIGKKLYFKTHTIGGVSYEFNGISGEEIIPNLDPPMRRPFIKGILARLKNRKLVEEEEIKFSHAVIN
jgi:hypothetical protein